MVIPKETGNQYLVVVSMDGRHHTLFEPFAWMDSVGPDVLWFESIDEMTKLGI